MPKVTDIKAQVKRKARFSIFLDEKYSFSLPDYEVFDQGIKIGLTLDDHEIERYKKLSDDSKLYELAYIKCLKRYHSVRELENYLRKKQVEQDLAQNIIDRLVVAKLLDDQVFADYWFEMRQKAGKSASYIRGELRSKGVDQSIVDEVMAEGADDSSALTKLIDKKIDRYETEQKLVQFLLRKGFRYSEVRDALKARSEG